MAYFDPKQNKIILEDKDNRLFFECKHYEQCQPHLKPKLEIVKMCGML